MSVTMVNIRLSFPLVQQDHLEAPDPTMGSGCPPTFLPVSPPITVVCRELVVFSNLESGIPSYSSSAYNRPSTVRTEIVGTTHDQQEHMPMNSAN